MDSPFIVPVVFFIMTGLTVILRGPLGQALAHRLRQGAEADPRLREDVEALRVEVDDLRHQLAESQERLDFAERLLARRGEAQQLPSAEG
jgi:hypothetical protein